MQRNDADIFPLLRLPKELIGHVASLLDYRDLQSLILVCKELNEHLKNPDVILSTQQNEPRTKILTSFIKLKQLISKQQKELFALKKTHETEIKGLNENLKERAAALKTDIHVIDTNIKKDLQKHQAILIHYAKKINTIKITKSKIHEDMNAFLEELEQYSQQVSIPRTMLSSKKLIAHMIGLILSISVLVTLCVLLNQFQVKIDHLERQYSKNPCSYQLTLRDQVGDSDSTICPNNYWSGCNTEQKAACLAIWKLFKELYPYELGYGLSIIGPGITLLFQMAILLFTGQNIKNSLSHTRNLAPNDRPLTFLDFKHRSQLQQWVSTYNENFLAFNIRNFSDFRHIAEVKSILKEVKEIIPYNNPIELARQIQVMLVEINKLLHDDQLKITKNNYLKTDLPYSSRFQLFSKIETIESRAAEFLKDQTSLHEIEILVDEGNSERNLLIPN